MKCRFADSTKVRSGTPEIVFAGRCAIYAFSNPQKFWQITNSSFQHPIDLGEDDDNPLPGNQVPTSLITLLRVFPLVTRQIICLFQAPHYPPMPNVNIIDGLKVFSSAGLDNIR